MNLRRVPAPFFFTVLSRIIMSQKSYRVRVRPSSGGGMPYDEEVTCTNPNQAQKIVLARIPDGWQINYPQEIK